VNDNALFELADLLPLLPHREPFLFVDRVLELDPHKSIVTERRLRADEPQFAGHFPGNPIMPGVLIAEALAQTCGLLIGLSEKVTSGAPPEKPKRFFLAATNLKFTHSVGPGDVLVLRATDDFHLSRMHRFNVQAICGEHLVAGGLLTLAET